LPPDNARQITIRLERNETSCQEVIIGLSGDGWYVGQAYYPFLVGPILVYNIYMSEVEIYHSYYPFNEELKTKKRGLKKKTADLLSKVAKYLAIVGVTFLIIAFAPSFWYVLKSGGVGKISEIILQTIQKQGEGEYIRELVYQPQYDPTLTRENRIKIPSVKIDTPILEATLENYEDALRKGVWRVSDFGTPADREKTTILAAHRFGYLAWSIPYRLKNSFYSLPRLKKGETVEIIWKQRKYIYEIYKEEKGEEISDYSADLILYTCESLNSSIKIFRYAKLLKI